MWCLSVHTFRFINTLHLSTLIVIIQYINIWCLSVCTFNRERIYFESLTNDTARNFASIYILCSFFCVTTVLPSQVEMTKKKRVYTAQQTASAKARRSRNWKAKSESERAAILAKRATQKASNRVRQRGSNTEITRLAYQTKYAKTRRTSVMLRERESAR